jgi:acyl-coenzyme A thioesterase PaaI-like protein
MVLTVTAALGRFEPMTTVQLQLSFLRPVPGDAKELLLATRILRKGKNLVFGEVQLSAPDGRLAAHATTTYALL